MFKGTLSAVTILFLIFSFSVLAQTSKENQKAEEEMKSMLGTIPVMFEVYPEHMRAGAWEWFKSTQNPNASIPPKYAQLISLGVASQIPCDYCIYAHTTMAKMLGATDAEIKEAIASAADTRHWSTVLNGNNVEYEDFKTEWDNILAHIKKHSEAEKTSRK